jgi:ribosomal protein S18 acetylase RimI-like enzyme
MQIRQFVLADYDAVVELWRQVGIPLSDADTFAAIMHRLERDPELFLVAEENGRIAGTAMGGFDGVSGWLQHVAVHPDFQNQGIGTRMVSELERRLKQLGCRRINVLVPADNAALQQFYSRQGFEPSRLTLMRKHIEQPPAV